MVIGKGRTDRHIDLKSSTRRIKKQFRSGKRIVLMQLQQAMIVAPFIRRIKPINNKMEIQDAVSLYQCIGNRIFNQLFLLFLQPF